MGVAVKVTPVPEQIAVAEAEILTDGVIDEITETVNEQDVLGEPASEYITVVTPELNVSPLAVPFPLPVVAPLNV